MKSFARAVLRLATCFWPRILIVALTPYGA